MQLILFALICFVLAFIVLPLGSKKADREQKKR
jgi:predicted secreted protein